MHRNHCYEKLKGYNSFKKKRIIFVIELIWAMMVMNLPMKFRPNPLRSTEVIAWKPLFGPPPTPKWYLYVPFFKGRHKNDLINVFTCILSFQAKFEVTELSKSSYIIECEGVGLENPYLWLEYFLGEITIIVYLNACMINMIYMLS